MSKPKPVRETIKVTSVPISIKNKISIIAANEGNTVSGWVREVIREKVNQYPADLRDLRDFD